MPKRYTVTAALPYTNGPIHIGHLAGAYIPGDIYSRYLRLLERDIIFICGSDEHGAAIPIRAKKEASIVGCMQLLKEKKVEAVFSAGSTGATLISEITILGKQKGVIRPAIASILPNSDSSVILLDSGASLDVKPKILYQFAVMGSKLAEVLL